jgi:hypothetical protein
MSDETQVRSPDRPTGPQWAQKYKFERMFRRKAVASYISLCIGIGAVALALPALLLIFGTGNPHYSISHYYHGGDTARSILVGSLWATGVFMFLYQGLSTAENRTLNIGGVAAISVAMNPVVEAQDHSTFGVHEASAIIFFACLAIVAIVFSRARLGYIIYPAYRRFFARAYTAAGATMIGMPVAIGTFRLLHGGDTRSDWIFWIESFGIWAFAVYWFVKTYEYRLLLRI